jgi:hypothetical protein
MGSSDRSRIIRTAIGYHKYAEFVRVGISQKSSKQSANDRAFVVGRDYHANHGTEYRCGTGYFHPGVLKYSGREGMKPAQLLGEF